MEGPVGAHPWFYFVPYEPDVAKCLEDLQQRELAAGRYNPVEPFPRFPVDLQRAPGGKHPSIEAARAAAGASGTRSILDVTRIGAAPDFAAVAPLAKAELTELFGTARPTAADVEGNDALFDQIERGHGVVIVVYADDEPSRLFFAGYSYD
jgi:hypothetical protein